MNAIVRRFRFQKSDVEPLSTGEVLTETKSSQPVPMPRSTSGPHVVNPYQVNAVIEQRIPATLCFRELITGLSIVFVHSLTGNRELMWIAKGAAACWLELFLINDLPEARIITYGYDADVVNFWSMASQNTIGGQVQKLLSSLANLRDSTNTVGSRAIKWAAQSIPFNRAQDRLVTLQTVFHRKHNAAM